MVYDIMNDKQRKAYEEFLECDFSFEIPKLARFRVNAFNQNRGAGAVFRTIPSKILSLEDLNCAEDLRATCRMQPRGLVLVTGPTGSGKSTTLAAMVNHCNENEYGHILTIEDPIEFVHESQEVPDQPARGAPRHARRSPTRCARRCAKTRTCILVGEMRDLETIRLALTAAETGHLVFGTLHTQLGRQDHRPHRRRVPGGGEGNGARDAVRVAARGDLADAAEDATAAAASRRTRS